jgi:hypothetical protein
MIYHHREPYRGNREVDLCSILIHAYQNVPACTDLAYKEGGGLAPLYFEIIVK